jgi:hypothetical protein
VCTRLMSNILYADSQSLSAIVFYRRIERQKCVLVYTNFTTLKCAFYLEILRLFRRKFEKLRLMALEHTASIKTIDL